MGRLVAVERGQERLRPAIEVFASCGARARASFARLGAGGGPRPGARPDPQANGQWVVW